MSDQIRSVVVRADESPPDYLLDTDAINKRYEAGFDNPYRIITGTVMVPVDWQGTKLEKWLRQSGDTLIQNMEKKNFRLASTLRIDFIPGPAEDSDTGLIRYDMIRYFMAGIFKYDGPFRIKRTEVDPALVKQAPDHTLTTAEAAKAWGVGLQV